MTPTDLDAVRRVALEHPIISWETGGWICSCLAQGDTRREYADHIAAVLAAQGTGGE